MEIEEMRNEMRRYLTQQGITIECLWDEYDQLNAKLLTLDARDPLDFDDVMRAKRRMMRIQWQMEVLSS